MKMKAINAPHASQPVGPYANAVKLTEFSELLFISGQVPVTADGTAPDGIRAQADQVWRNIDAQLSAAGMTRENLVKATTFLANRDCRAANRDARDAYLGDHKIALTVIVAEIFEEEWLIEIEAIAAR